VLSEPPEQMLIRLRPRAETLHVSKGRTVLAMDRDGFLQGIERGLFVHETRLLSRYRYRVDGQPFHPVSISNVAQHSWLGYYIAPAPDRLRRSGQYTVADAAQQSLELRLSRYVGEGLHEDVDLTNYTQESVEFTLELEWIATSSIRRRRVARDDSEAVEGENGLNMIRYGNSASTTPPVIPITIRTSRASRKFVGASGFASRTRRRPRATSIEVSSSRL
jgi:hypothetical protein